MNNFFVSIVIPCYNVASYIEECLESAFAQEKVEVEVIVVDNNSSDNTLAILKELKQSKYPDLIILSEKKPGASAARNKGLSIAKGEWIQFLDADDLLMSNKLLHQLNLISNSNNQNISFVAGACTHKKVNGEIVNTSVLENNPFVSLFKKQLGNTCSNLWNKESVTGVNGWNENLKSSQEPDLMFRLLKSNGKVLFDNKSLTIIRQRESGNISNRSVENMIRYLELRMNILDHLKSKVSIVYSDNKKLLYEHLYRVIRVMAKKDIHEADRYFCKIFNGKIELDLKSKKEQIMYRMIQLFGFKNIVGLYQKVVKV